MRRSHSVGPFVIVIVFVLATSCFIFVFVFVCVLCLRADCALVEFCECSFRLLLCLVVVALCWLGAVDHC